jgi:hypothetical protein
VAGSEAARVALEAVWTRMVELVEDGHDVVVMEQVSATAGAAKRIAAIATDLATLAKAADALGRGAHDGA